MAVETAIINEAPVELPVGAGRLGRHMQFDDQSRAYGVVQQRALDPITPLTSKRWTRRFGAWNQGNIGKCTIMGLKGSLLTYPVRGGLTSAQVSSIADTTKMYSDETANDPFPGQYPPDDTGSSVLAAMQLAKRWGLIAAYHWGFSFDDCLRALSQVGPVEVGVNWYTSFDTPDANGVVSLPSTATVRGGHAFEINEILVDRQMVGAYNSWGQGWGVKGRFFIPWSVLERLLSSAESGECAIPQAA